MKNEFELAFNEVVEQKRLPKDVILEALNAAMVSAYRRSKNASNAQHIEAEIDTETGRVSIFAEKEVVEVVEDERTEVSLEDARKVDADSEIGGMVVVETTPRNFGRVAAQTARQVIQQRIREAEREAQFEYYSKQIGEIISGVVQSTHAGGVTLGMDMKAEGIMPRNQQIRGERFRVHDRVRALLLEIKSTPRGPQIILSRAHSNFLRRLLENEVPEVYHGLVEIRSISREPGHRSKVAVSALQAGVDPVGACVGIRGVRIQAIVRELNDEKIDVIEWNPDATLYIAKSLSPARVAGVYLKDLANEAKTATVVVPEDQLSLAIGRDGQNARLAAKLTSWRIDIKSLPEAATDALYKLQKIPSYAEIAEGEAEICPQVEIILAKKTEGRPITPEEYRVLTQFVDRVEKGINKLYKVERDAEQERIQEVRSTIPDPAFKMPLEKFEVADRVYAVISEAGFQTVGDLMLQWKLDSDEILALKGMGPKGMKVLEGALDSVTYPVEEIVEEAAVEEGEADVETPEATEEVSEEAPQIEGVEAEIPSPETAVADLEKGAPKEDELEVEPVAEAEVPAAEELGEEEKVLDSETEPDTFEEIVSQTPDVLEFELVDEEIEEIEGKKKKEKKKKYIEIEYDPDHDAMLVKKKRKREVQDWEKDW
ncbi:MAG: transcription termination factor NusA [Anaerolineales bacterium]